MAFVRSNRRGIQFEHAHVRNRRRRALLLVSVLAMTAMMANSGSAFAWRECISAIAQQVSAVARGSPTNSELQINNTVDVFTKVQGKNNWRIMLGQAGGDYNDISFMLAKQGEALTYRAIYDSLFAKVKPPSALNLKRVMLMVSQGIDPTDFDWAIDLQGNGERYLTVTADDGAVTYDASLALKLPLSERLNFSYVVDAKRRAIEDGPRFNPWEKQYNLMALKPDWIRQGGSLVVGDLKISAFQRDPDSPEEAFDLDFFAEYSPDTTHLLGHVRSSALLIASRQEGESRYVAAVNITALKGIHSGFSFELVNGTPKLTTYGNYSADDLHIPGMEMLTITGGGGGSLGANPLLVNLSHLLSMEPVHLNLEFDLASLAPGVLQNGSQLNLRTDYQFGEEAPKFNADVILKANNKNSSNSSQLGTYQITTKGKIIDSGEFQGGIQLLGTSRALVPGSRLDYRYEGGVSLGISISGAELKQHEHLLEVMYFPDEVVSDVLQAVCDVSTAAGYIGAVEVERYAGAFVRVMKDSAKHAGKLRLQVGFSCDLSGDGIRRKSEESIYDSQDDEDLMDNPWLKATQDKVKGFRQKIASSKGKGIESLVGEES